jgi:hypothetical protein
MTMLDEWSLATPDGKGLACPGDPNVRIRGFVWNHQWFEDGKRIVTAKIIDVEGYWVQTEQGHTYQLGAPDLHWLRFLQASDVEFDDKDPLGVKLRRRLAPKRLLAHPAAPLAPWAAIIFSVGFLLGVLW